MALAHPVRMAVRLAFAAFAILTAPNLAIALDFEAAQAAALASPALRAARAALAVRQRLDRELPAQSGNPELTATVGPAVPGPVVSVAVGAAQTFNLGGLPAARARAAEAERAAMTGELRVLQAEARLGAAAAWIAAWTARDLQRVASAEAAVAADLADAATRAAGRAALTAGDAAEARLYAAEARVAVAGHVAAARAAASALASACALPAEPPPAADGPLPPAPAGSADPALDRWPAAAAARLAALAERARAAETAAAAASLVAVGGQLQLDPNGNFAALATFGLRWALFDRGQRATASAAATVERQAGVADAAHADAQRTLATARALATAAAQVEAEIRDQALPAARALVAARQLAFARGAGTTFELLRARRALLDMERRAVAAAGDRAWAAWRLAILLAAAEAP